MIVLVKEPFKAWTARAIDGSLASLQQLVDGYIECIPLRDDLVLIVNEEGKLRGLAPNFRIGHGVTLDIIVGEAIVIGIQGEELVDLPISFKMWKQIMYEWGNI